MSDIGGFFGGGGFDTNSVPPQEDFVVIPPDNYVLLIEGAEVKPTKANTGHYLELTLQVMDGPHKGRKVWDRINIQNPSQKCQEIGLRSLAALGLALNIPRIGDAAQLLNQVVIGHVKVKDGQNEVRTYSALTPAGAPGVPQVPQQPYYPPTQAPQYAPPAPPQQQYAPPQQQYAPQPQGPAPAQTGAGRPPWARG